MATFSETRGAGSSQDSKPKVGILRGICGSRRLVCNWGLERILHTASSPSLRHRYTHPRPLAGTDIKPIFGNPGRRNETGTNGGGQKVANLTMSDLTKAEVDTQGTILKPRHASIYLYNL